MVSLPDCDPTAALGTGAERGWFATRSPEPAERPIEDFAFHHKLTVPGWTLDESRFLDEWWFVTRFADLHPTAMVESPPAIANRGVFIRRASLVNV